MSRDRDHAHSRDSLPTLFLLANFCNTSLSIKSMLAAMQVLRHQLLLEHGQSTQ